MSKPVKTILFGLLLWLISKFFNISLMFDAGLELSGLVLVVIGIIELIRSKRKKSTDPPPQE